MTKLTRQEKNNKLDPIIRDLLIKTCPKCNSGEIGFNLMTRKWDCHSCKHSWSDIKYV